MNPAVLNPDGQGVDSVDEHGSGQIIGADKIHPELPGQRAVPKLHQHVAAWPAPVCLIASEHGDPVMLAHEGEPDAVTGVVRNAVCVVGQVAADEAGRGRIAAAHDLYVGGELYLAEVREIGVDFGAPGRPPAAYAVRTVVGDAQLPLMHAGRAGGAGGRLAAAVWVSVREILVKQCHHAGCALLHDRIAPVLVKGFVHGGFLFGFVVHFSLVETGGNRCRRIGFGLGSSTSRDGFRAGLGVGVRLSGWLGRGAGGSIRAGCSAGAAGTTRSGKSQRQQHGKA